MVHWDFAFWGPICKRPTPPRTCGLGPIDRAVGPLHLPLHIYRGPQTLEEGNKNSLRMHIKGSQRYHFDPPCTCAGAPSYEINSSFVLDNFKVFRFPSLFCFCFSQKKSLFFPIFFQKIMDLFWALSAYFMIPLGVITNLILLSGFKKMWNSKLFKNLKLIKIFVNI